MVDNRRFRAKKLLNILAQQNSKIKLGAFWNANFTRTKKLIKIRYGLCIELYNIPQLTLFHVICVLQNVYNLLTMSEIKYGTFSLKGTSEEFAFKL